MNTLESYFILYVLIRGVELGFIFYKRSLLIILHTIYIIIKIAMDYYSLWFVLVVSFGVLLIMLILFDMIKLTMKC